MNDRDLMTDDVKLTDVLLRSGLAESAEKVAEIAGTHVPPSAA